MFPSTRDLSASSASIFDPPQSARSALDELTTALLEERGRGSVWRVSSTTGRSAAELLGELSALEGEDLALSFEPAIFEQIDDPAALIAFCARRASQVILAYEPSRLRGHPLTRSDFERRLLLSGASFRELIKLEGDGRAYSLHFEGSIQ